MTKIIDNYYFFWKNRSPLSNWYQEEYTCKVTLSNSVTTTITFNDSEQHMMALKAILFDDLITLKKILLAKKPSEQKALGREVKNFDQKTWEAIREQIVYDVLYHKFTNSSQPTQDFLKNTAPYDLVEASPYDTIWGIGMSEDETGIEDESNWKGLNLLGKLLTKLRIELYGN